MAASGLTFKQLRKDFNMKNLFKYFGENQNGAIIIACGIAIGKGIFRPLFTMMDKQQDPDTKKYAAIREGLTEVAAFPLYIATPLVASHLIHHFLKGKEIPPAEMNRLKINAKYIGVCVATLIIPAICNLIQPPIMHAYEKHEKEKKDKTNKLDITSASNIQPPSVIVDKPAVPINNTIQKPLPTANSNMRVGN